MEYKVLYRKYRPDCFKNIVGQDYTIKMLQNAIIHDKISHAYLFTGPRGRGQGLVADWLAMRLMCRNVTADGQPDGMCDQCQRIASNEHPDVIQLAPDGNSIKVDQVRFLRDSCNKNARRRSRFRQDFSKCPVYKCSFRRRKRKCRLCAE